MNIVNYSYMSLLLRIISEGSGIEPLLNKGLTYSQIAELTNAAIQEGFIINSENELKLTALGQKRFKRLESGKACSNGNWIIPETESKIDKMSIYDVYLPSMNKSCLD